MSNPSEILKALTDLVAADDALKAAQQKWLRDHPPLMPGAMHGYGSSTQTFTFPDPDMENASGLLVIAWEAARRALEGRPSLEMAPICGCAPGDCAEDEAGPGDLRCRQRQAEAVQRPTGEDREQPTLRARKECAAWLAECMRIGWARTKIDALEALWWEHHDRLGNLKDSQPEKP